MDKLRKVLQDVNEEMCRSEELGWLSALLDLVDVTKPGAAEYLKFFSKDKSQVLRTHHTQLAKDVCTSKYRYVSNHVKWSYL